MLQELVSNRIIVAVIITMVLAQFAKVVVYWIRHKQLKMAVVFDYGGMPSSHSATAGSLVTAVYLVEGLSSLFAVTLILGIVMVRDALGTSLDTKRTLIPLKLRNLFVHTPTQALAGVLIGIVITIIVFQL